MLLHTLPKSHHSPFKHYFEFATFFFQQIKVTALGAAFSPTIANIFLFVTLKRYLHTQSLKPLLFQRYIDDIIII